MDNTLVIPPEIQAKAQAELNPLTSGESGVATVITLKSVSVSPTYQVELLLELLVGIVNTKLLKAVHFKGLKPAEGMGKKCKVSSVCFAKAILTHNSAPGYPSQALQSPFPALVLSDPLVTGSSTADSPPD